MRLSRSVRHRGNRHLLCALYSGDRRPDSRHPNIAAIYGLQDADGTTALVLELVEGPTLADRIATGPIPRDEALSIATQIIDALHAAHLQGIVHRDLKPSNIKLRPDGAVKVLDFGLQSHSIPIALTQRIRPPSRPCPALV
jgi:serine/threonine protein kinase